MANSKRYRWVCPVCNTGVLLGPRPRKDNTQRFCLSCSAKTGKMVERACPALEREREEKRRRKVSAKRKVQGRKAAERREEKRHQQELKELARTNKKRTNYMFGISRRRLHNICLRALGLPAGFMPVIELSWNIRRGTRKTRQSYLDSRIWDWWNKAATILRHHSWYHLGPGVRRASREALDAVEGKRHSDMVDYFYEKVAAEMGWEGPGPTAVAWLSVQDPNTIQDDDIAWLNEIRGGMTPEELVALDMEIEQLQCGGGE